MASLGRRMFPALCAVCKHRQSISKPVTLPQLVKKFHFRPATINSVRSFSSTMSTETKVQKEKVSITFNLSDGRTSTVQAKVGDNLLDVIIDNDVDIDGFGACEGTLACSTCHLIFAPADFERLEEKATDEELDMLDLAYELTDTSRLGCQVIVAKDMDGLVVDVPCGVADARDV